MVCVEDVKRIKLLRKYLKFKILENNIVFEGHNNERRHLFDLVKRTIKSGESHSALIIGPRGSGKTTLVNSVLHNVRKEVDLKSDAIIVHLNGLVHSDDKIALKAMASQMELENAVGDRVFGTFAENLQFLLNCIKSGSDRSCKSMVFVLDEFHMFCRINQTLLYNLFDIAHNEIAPILVLGLTCRLDVLEKLEKRVKSRFSHRHLFLFPNEDSKDATPTERYIELFRSMLTMPVFKGKPMKRKKGRPSKESQSDYSSGSDTENDNYTIPKATAERCKLDLSEFNLLDSAYIDSWNNHIRELTSDEHFVDAIEKFCYYSVNKQIFKDVLYQLVSRISPDNPALDVKEVSNLIDSCVTPEHRLSQLTSLSVLEFSLLIAVKHQLDIFNDQPFNFEMLLHRYTKFANANSSAQAVPRPVILKAFEHLQSLELIVPIKNESSDSSGLQKEYRLLTLSIPKEEILNAVQHYKNLPTEISHWASSSIV